MNILYLYQKIYIGNKYVFVFTAGDYLILLFPHYFALLHISLKLYNEKYLFPYVNKLFGSKWFE